MNIKITKKWLKDNNACESGVRWLEKNTGIGASAVDILNDLLATIAVKNSHTVNGHFRWLAVRCMTWAQRAEWAIFCAEQVIDIYEKHKPGNTAPRKAIEAAKKCIANPTPENKRAAAYAAYAAHAAAYAAYAAYADAAKSADADAAAYTAHAAAYAAYAAYADAAAHAAHAAHAARAAAYAAYAAYAAAADADADAKRQKMRKICAKEAIRIISL